MKSYLLRAVLPSWKFFEDFGETPVLYFRAGAEEEAFGDWVPWLEKRDRRWHHLFLNAGANEALASGALLQRLVNELADVDEVGAYEQSVTYQLIKNLVSHRVTESAPEGAQYQFKVSVTDDVLVSPVYEA